MSMDRIAWAMSQDNLRCHAKMVLIFLGDHPAPITGVQGMSIKTLSEKCGMSTTGVKDNLAVLEKLGLITRHANFDEEDGARLANTYVMNLNSEDLS